MTRQAAILSTLAAGLTLVTGCSDGTGPKNKPRSTPLDSLPGLIVSQPVGGIAASGAVLSIKSGAAVAGGAVYVSMVPGSVPTGVEATIRDQENGSSVIAPVVDGGFDPVAIPADVGDSLLVEVSTFSSAGPVRGMETVRAKRPPMVIRTNPPAGGRDVPLNSRMVVVFSDPIDPATLTTGSVQLWRDTTLVAGTVQFSDSIGVKAEFRPDSPLAQAAAYRLVVTTAISDLSGHTLEAGVETDFSTAQPSILVDASRDGGVWWFPQAGAFEPGANHQGKALADYLRSKGYQVDELGRPYEITLALLQRYTIVIRAGEFGTYTPSEISAYQGYVLAGGRVLLAADHMLYAPPDGLGRSFGLEFAGVTRGPNAMQLSAGHPITNGLSSLVYGVGSALLSVPDSAVVLGALDSASYVDLNFNSVQDAGEPSAPPVLGAMSFGSGRIVFCGDVNLWEWDTAHGLVDNVLAWLEGETPPGPSAVRMVRASAKVAGRR